MNSQLRSPLRFDVSPEEFSLFNLIVRISNLVLMFSVVPLLKRLLRLHETDMMVLFTIVGAASLIASAVAKRLWGFIIAMTPGETRFLLYPTGIAYNQVHMRVCTVL